MPAIIDDPASPTIYRVSGEPPFPDPNKPTLPASITPRQVTLRDKQTVATVVPFISQDQVPPSLLLYLADQFAKEIIKGDTYPMMEPMSHEKFAAYWFQNFGAIMLLGDIEKPENVVEGKDWAKECLGSFYIKPNYPGRSSHICNAGFLVTDASRNRGVGRLMGEAYLNWAPKLGYSYSVFNLVYETNVASCRIWDALGFKRIGRVPRCGNLKSYPGRLVDAIIYGRDLSENEEVDEIVSQERFEKIKFYLKHGKYPDGADRAEKSRLRSSATHYTLSEGDVLMLNNKECIADSGQQYDIAREFHARQHGGINKTTAAIAEKYHWSRIKDTVSDVIRACTECNEVKDTSKSPNVTTLVKSPTMNSDPFTVGSVLPPSNAPQADSNHGTRDEIVAKLVCHACQPPKGTFTNTESLSKHCWYAHGKRLTSHEGAAAHKDAPLTVNENDMNVGPAVVDENALSVRQPGLQSASGQYNDLFGLNDSIGSPHHTLPSAGLDMGQHDPELAAILNFLATPTLPHTVMHHDYQPIDPQLTNHEQSLVGQLSDPQVPFNSSNLETNTRHEAFQQISATADNTVCITSDRPLYATHVDEMGAFFAGRQVSGDDEGTKMDIDSGQEPERLDVSHEAYHGPYHDVKEGFIQNDKENPRQKDGSV